ncbi:MAG: bifunctional glycosyltransferase family 2 protein/class I SAM-dependent methyltransferase [Nitrospirota bacterium]
MTEKVTPPKEIRSGFPRVSIIILNWNKLEYLKQCIENAVKNTDYPNYEIIVLDNASTETGTREYLESLPYISIMSPVNLGFGKGNNKAARAASGEYLLLLNNDTIPKHDWLTPMVDLMLNTPGCGIVGSKLLYPDGTIQHIGVYMDFKGRRKHYFKKYPANIPEALEVRECEAVTAACLLIKKSVFEKVGGFDERYIQGVEDMDLCLKVRELGYKIFFCPHSVLIHFEGSSMKDMVDKQRKKNKKRNDRNNEKIFHKKWGKKIDSFMLELHPWKFKSYSYYTREFSHIVNLIPPTAKNILDVGCGAGLCGKEIRGAGIRGNIVGIEINPVVAKDAEMHMDRVIVGDVENLDIPGDTKFDCIILGDILEHLIDPWTILRKLSECLSEDGIVIASIPNIRHYKIIKDILRDRWFYRKDGILDGGHLRFFGISTIKHMFSVSRLDIVKTERLQKAEGFMKLLNKILAGKLNEFLTYQYLIVAKRKKTMGNRGF